MFFILNLKKNLQVTPEYLGKKISIHLLALLKRAVEGSFNSRYGYLVKVLTVDKYGEGKVQEWKRRCAFSSVIQSFSLHAIQR